jgi:hypothetical protein
VKILLKKIILILIFNISLLNANTIAVVSDTQKSELSNKFGKDIIAILDSQKRYEIVEQEKIEDIYKELQKSQTGLVNQEEAAKLGYLKGIHYFIYYNINKQENNIYVGNFRIVKTETGTIIGAGRSKGDYENTLSDLSQQIIHQLDIYLNLNNPQSPYTILIKLNKEKPQYRVGETLQIKFKVVAHKNAQSKKVYIQLFSIDATGKITMIYPNKYSGFEPVEIDKEYIFPSPKDDFEWELTPPTGTEYIQAFVSERPIDIFQTWNKAKEELFPESKENGNLLTTYRGIQTKLKKEKIENWSAMRIAYELLE